MTTDEARQLADRLEHAGHGTVSGIAPTAATVLREQADEIDRLEAEMSAVLNVLADHPDAVMRAAVADVVYPLTGEVE